MCCSGAKRRSISRFATAASADDGDLAFAAEHADSAELASEAAAAVSVDVDISQLEVSKFRECSSMPICTDRKLMCVAHAALPQAELLLFCRPHSSNNNTS